MVLGPLGANTERAARPISPVALLARIAACAQARSRLRPDMRAAAYNARGRIGAAAETFSGRVTGYRDETGLIAAMTATRVIRRGNNVCADASQGGGDFACDGGPSGASSFATARPHGRVEGLLGDAPFDLTFDNGGPSA
jgi:hypothetical protein